jgi:hypothetical protein
LQSVVFNPGVINVNSPPSSVTATGSGFSAQYGSQIVQFYDASGNLADQQAAKTNSSTSLTISSPDLSVGNGTIARYLGIILNEDGHGYYYAVGTAPFEVTARVSCPTSPCSYLSPDQERLANRSF